MDTTLPRILLVDDESSILDGLRRQLRRDFAVTTATSGPAGLRLLEEDPGFAVVMSDMRMPDMDGATFLARVRQQAPAAVRLLLTGQADIDAAISAINDGQIFRFLTKPCPPELLLEALRAAAEQHRLLTAERELLEHTLRGSVQALLESLALANPTAFARAMRIKRLVADLVDQLGVADHWEIQIAAMLSQIGTVTLPPAVVDKLHRGHELTDNEQAMVDRLPRIAERLLAGIPRLEQVREAIRWQQRRFDGRDPQPGPAGEAIPLGARLLRVALDFDPLESRGLAAGEAVAALRQQRGRYDPAVLDALAWVRRGAADAEPTVEIAPSELRPGMRLASDVRSSGGMLLVGRGQVVTDGLLERLRNFSAQAQIEDLVSVVAPGGPR